MNASGNSIRLEAQQLMAYSRVVLHKAGVEITPEMIERVICTAPTMNTDLTAEGLRERSFCISCLVRQEMPPGSFDLELEAAAEFFIDYLPTLSAESRRWLHETAIGFLRGMTGKISVVRPARQRKTAMAASLRRGA